MTFLVSQFSIDAPETNIYELIYIERLTRDSRVMRTFLISCDQLFCHHSGQFLFFIKFGSISFHLTIMRERDEDYSRNTSCELN